MRGRIVLVVLSTALSVLAVPIPFDPFDTGFPPLGSVSMETSTTKHDH